METAECQEQLTVARSRLTIILALHTRHDFLHQILTGNPELLQVQELADGGSRSFGVVLGDDENGRRDSRLGCLGLEEELRGRVNGDSSAKEMRACQMQDASREELLLPSGALSVTVTRKILSAIEFLASF